MWHVDCLNPSLESGDEPHTLRHFPDPARIDAAPLYTSSMRKKAFHPSHLDIEAFCRAGETLSGQNRLEEFERLQEREPDAGSDTSPSASSATVRWSAAGEWRSDQPQAGAWLHLDAQTCVPRTCQRCLQPMTVDLLVDRSFRFVETESLAADLDEDSDDDVLVASRNFNLLELIEDELLMDLPIVPMHDDCETIPISMSAANHTVPPEPPPSDTDRPNPFAVLQSLAGRIRKGDPDPLP